MMDLNRLLGILNLLASFVLLWAALRITTTAGFRNAQELWALFRRFVYISATLTLFILGVGRLDGDFHTVPSQALCQIALNFNIVIFPLLRALGWITQDQFRAVDGSAARERRRKQRWSGSVHPVE